MIAKNRDQRERERTQLVQLEKRFESATITEFTDRSRGFVYVLIFRDEVVYCGQTNNIDARIQSHIGRGDKLFDRVLWLEVPTDEMGAYEGALIRALAPKLNGRRTPKDMGRDAEILEQLGLSAQLRVVA